MMKKILALLLVCVMALSFAACGDKEEAQPENENLADGAERIDDVSKLKPEANVDPAKLNIGQARDEAHSGDAWYKDGVRGENYIYFEKADNSKAGIAYVKVENGEKAQTILCALTEDQHVVDQDAEEGKSSIDIVFYDDFKAYDYKNETWYVRGNPETTGRLFEGRKFVCQGSEDNTLILNEDGTGTELFEGKEDKLTWQMDSASTLRYNDGAHDFVLEIVCDENGNIVSLNEQNFRVFVPAE
ncbi:MAG: hypothetical protein ACOX68_00900 [Candidatus Limivicinus sp.]|jgi:hypothetical protein